MSDPIRVTCHRDIRRWVLVLTIAAGLAGVPLRPALAESAVVAAPLEQRLQNLELLFSFQGKGSSLSYDAGVVKKAFECLPALADGRVIVTGNSSGAIFAVYFSCFGFSETSVRYAEYKITHANVDEIRKNENVPRKAVTLLRNENPEISHSALHEYIAFAIGVEDWQGASDSREIARRSKLRPHLPVVIAAANADVLDNRGPGYALAAKNYKLFDPATYDVSWKPDVYEFYRRHPEQFARENPRLRLGDTPYIGKACTCFVDQTMYDLLSQIPAEERLCDLRLMTNADDMALAIEASVSEPSYFKPIAERDYDKLRVGDVLGKAGNSRQRVYCGGFIMPMVAQDVRRMLPQLRVLGTSTSRVPLAARQLVKAWYLVDVEEVGERCIWWTDLCTPLTREVKIEMVQRKVSREVEVQRGYDQAAACIALDSVMPKYVIKPHFRTPAAAALSPDAPNVDWTETEDGERELKTFRGIGPLLKRSNAP